MAGLLALVCAVCVWALLFKPFFGDRDGFRNSLKCALLQGHAHSWTWSGQVGPNIRSAVKFYVWIILGCISGALVRVFL